MSDPREHQPTCQREIMRHADDTAAYLSEPCTCDPLVAPVVGGTPELERLVTRWRLKESQHLNQSVEAAAIGEPETDDAALYSEAKMLVYRECADDLVAALVPRPEPREPEPPHQRESETLSTLSLRELIDDLEPKDRARVQYEQLMALLDSTPRPHRVTPPMLRGEHDCVWCAGCGAWWRSPGGFLLAGVVHLCGDCWRRVQPILHAEVKDAAVRPASAPSLEHTTGNQFYNDLLNRPDGLEIFTKAYREASQAASAPSRPLEDEIVSVIRDLVDSIEYVDRAHPGTTGSGVRADRRARAMKLLRVLVPGGD